MTSPKSILSIAAKLGLAGATICAIAWGVLVLQPDGSVKESDADILDLSSIKLSNSARFARGLKHLGHDTPQTFLLNGNVVNFSMKESRKRPEQLALEYQEEFIHQDLNKTVWTAQNTREPEDKDRMLLEAMTGGIMPIVQTDEYVSLGGVIPANDATDKESLFKLSGEEAEEDGRLFKGHHFVEMFWDEARRKTNVTATWSDENFNYRKMVSNDASDIDEDPEVPSCPGCTRISRMRNLNSAKPYGSNIFTSRELREDPLAFYRRTMPARGWDETESSQVLGTVRPHLSFEGDEVDLVQFSRGPQFLTVLVYPDGRGGTTVHTTMSD